MSGGIFITIEGGEGTGKSTLISGLEARLRQAGITCVLTREPGGTPLAEQLRKLVLTPPGDAEWSPMATALLMNAARDDHLLRKIRPALAKGEWVVCDRFADSTRAYQSIDGVSGSILRQFEDAVLGETRPDLTFILDADPEYLQERRRHRGTMDTFERKDKAFHQKVRAAFLQIAEDEPDRCAVLDATGQPGDIIEAAFAEIEKRFLS